MGTQQRRPRRELVRARKERGLTQEEAAAAINVAASTWARWERGERTPHNGHLKQIARAFEAPINEVIGWIEPPPSTRPAPSREAPVPDLGDPTQIVADATAAATSNIAPPVLETARSSISQVVDRYEESGPRPLITETQLLRKTLHSLLRGQQPPRQRRELFALTAQAAGLLAYMAVNLGRPAVADAYCAEASLMAELAEDTELLMWIGGTRSFNLYYQQRYGEADEAAAAAIEVSPTSPQAIRLLINGRARALARMEDSSSRRRTERMIGQAMELSDRLDDRLPSGVSPCIAFVPYSRARTLANAVTAYVSLGEPGKALEHATAINEMVDHSDSRWTQALVRLDVATALLHQRSPEVEQSMSLGEEALEMTRAAPIRSVWQRASELEAHVAGWVGHDTVAQYSAHLREWRADPLARTVAGN